MSLIPLEVQSELLSTAWSLGKEETVHDYIQDLDKLNEFFSSFHFFHFLQWKPRFHHDNPKYFEKSHARHVYGQNFTVIHSRSVNTTFEFKNFPFILQKIQRYFLFLTVPSKKPAKWIQRSHMESELYYWKFKSCKKEKRSKLLVPQC